MPNRRTDDGRRIVHVNVYGYVNGGGRDRNEPRSAPIELADMRGGRPEPAFPLRRRRHAPAGPARLAGPTPGPLGSRLRGVAKHGPQDTLGARSSGVGGFSG